MANSSLRDTPLYNSRILDSYLRLMRQRYPFVDLTELWEYAGVKSYEVADQAHWFTQEQVERFYEKLVQLTGNSNLAREAGRFAASPEALGAMRQYVLGLIGVSNTFQRISKLTVNFTRSARYESRRLSAGKVEIVVVPLEEGLEKPFQCENRIGFFEAVVLVFTGAPPVIEHPECLFAGGQACRYRISFRPSRAQLLRKVANLALPLWALFNLALMLLGRWALLPLMFPASLTLALILLVAALAAEKRELNATLGNTRESNDKLLEQINRNFNNALLANEIGRALGSYTDLASMLREVAAILKLRLDYDRGLVMLASEDQSRLELKASYGFDRDDLDCLERSSFRLVEPRSSDIYVQAFVEQRPVVINQLSNLGQTLEARQIPCAKSAESHAFICCPIVSEGVSIGVLAVEEWAGGKPLVESDISLIMGTASMIGISVRNAELIDALKRAKEELELRVAQRTQDLEQSRERLAVQHQELVRTYRELQAETSQRLQTLEKLRESERLMIQQSRLAALGEMISNIAHQWRQPLNELGLIVQEIPIMFDQGQFSREYLKGSVGKFMTVLGHLSKTIDDFRNFFKPDREKVSFAVGEVLERSLTLISESFRHLGIGIELKGSGDPVLQGYPNEFSQVLLNLLFNARDAFLEREIEARRIVIEYFAEGERTVVLVTDNAGGIPEEILERIFDPYFTTRGPEKGTGIGLYMSKTIIEKNLQGRLSARNVGDGAQFRIEL